MKALTSDKGIQTEGWTMAWMEPGSVSPYHISRHWNERRDRKRQRQRDNFRRQHIDGEHGGGKRRNTRAEDLVDQRVVPLRLSGSSSAQRGREEGELLYSTIDAVQYRGTGLVDNAIEGQGSLVITGVQEEEGGRGVAGVHLNGVATRIDDRHLQFGNEVYSQCLSQISQTQRIIEH